MTFIGNEQHQYCVSIEHPCRLSTCPPMEINTAVFQYSSCFCYSAFEPLLGSLKVIIISRVVETQENRAGLSRCIDLKRLSRRIRVFLSGNNYEDSRKPSPQTVQTFFRPRGNRKLSLPKTHCKSEHMHIV